MGFHSISNLYKDHPEDVSAEAPKDPIERQILDAGHLSETQLAAIRTFQRHKGIAFSEAAVTLGLVRRDSLLLGLSKHYSYPVLSRGRDEAQFSRELVAGYQPFGKDAEAFRSVRSALTTGLLSKGKKAFAVLGAHSGVGKTYFAANLALSFAQMAVRTLLVEANLRQPRLASLFGVDPKSQGLVEALTQPEKNALPIVGDIVPGLSLLAAGAFAPHPQELLSSKQFLNLSQAIERAYDVIIYDTPAALDSADAYVVASRVGSAVLVARRHRNKIKDIKAVSDALEGFQCEIAGTVLGRF